MRRMTIASLILLFFVAASAFAEERESAVTKFMRWSGYGIGDGYHVCPCPRQERCRQLPGVTHVAPVQCAPCQESCRAPVVSEPIPAIPEFSPVPAANESLPARTSIVTETQPAEVSSTQRLKFPTGATHYVPAVSQGTGLKPSVQRKTKHLFDGSLWYGQNRLREADTQQQIGQQQLGRWPHVSKAQETAAR
ncbi:MAG: hypothetical protein KDB27_08000 [Planctomycetales bacterium]|nr:hypothetical protein [Planctomycetales bacterium]